MKKQKRFFMFLIFIFIILINVNTFATSIGKGFFDGKINGQGTDGVFNAGASIINLFQVIGAGMAVIATLILGIRYMYSSPNEKADVKSKLIPWIVGGVLIFGAMGIVKFIENVIAI